MSATDHWKLAAIAGYIPGNIRGNSKKGIVNEASYWRKNLIN